MQMNIDSKTLRQRRQSKYWSQEELAIASGLGVRTIQRIESTGKGSLDSLKSLASALELSVEDLTLQTSAAEYYFNVQLGYTILAVLLSALVLCVWQFKEGSMQPEVFITAVVVLSIASTLFGSLSVKVNKETLTWYFGIGLWKKKLKLEQIKSAKKVRNKGWWGWGIRYYGEGWLYNVSGFGAVELTLIDGRRLRIGSDEPEKLEQTLNRKIVY